LRGKVIPPGAREDLMPQAASDLEKYARLTAGTEISEQLKEDVENLRFYATHYSKPENREVTVRDPNQPPDPTVTSIKILTKPRPGYTDDARFRNVSGTVTYLWRLNRQVRSDP
jgi:hypothetical protein